MFSCQPIVLNPKPDDSPMIKEMKTHMLRKLNNRYNDQQMAFLTILTYLDPRFKGEVNPDMTLLKSKIKKIVEATGPNIIPPTQNQEYHNLQNNTFATPICTDVAGVILCESLSTLVALLWFISSV